MKGGESSNISLGNILNPILHFSKGNARSHSTPNKLPMRAFRSLKARQLFSVTFIPNLHALYV